MRLLSFVMALGIAALVACGPSGAAPAAPAKPTAATAPSPGAPAATSAPAASAPAAKPELAPLTFEIGLPTNTAFTWPFFVIRDGPIGDQEGL